MAPELLCGLDGVGGDDDSDDDGSVIMRGEEVRDGRPCDVWSAGKVLQLWMKDERTVVEKLQEVGEEDDDDVGESVCLLWALSGDMCHREAVARPSAVEALRRVQEATITSTTTTTMGRVTSPLSNTEVLLSSSCTPSSAQLRQEVALISKGADKENAFTSGGEVNPVVVLNTLKAARKGW